MPFQLHLRNLMTGFPQMLVFPIGCEISQPRNERHHGLLDGKSDRSTVVTKSRNSQADRWLYWQVNGTWQEKHLAARNRQSSRKFIYVWEICS